MKQRQRRRAKALTLAEQGCCSTGKTVAEIESLPFKSFDGLDVEAFLTKPAEIEAPARSIR